jgi:hypothetical protein
MKQQTASYFTYRFSARAATGAPHSDGPLPQCPERFIGLIQCCALRHKLRLECGNLRLQVIC